MNPVIYKKNNTSGPHEAYPRKIGLTFENQSKKNINQYDLPY